MNPGFGCFLTFYPAQPKEDEARNEPELQDTRKRKEPKDFDTSFEVIRETLNPRKKTYSLKLIKPSSTRINTYPSVRFMEESINNKYAFDIMHNLHHKNILSLKLLASKEIDGMDPSFVAAFVELYSGKLWEILDPEECVDNVGHIPSPRLRRILRDIVIAIDFIRKNGLYHGNLSWKSTLHFDDVVKLAGFKMNESEDPQWNDWLSFIRMLEELSERVKHSNELHSTKYFTGNIDSLIAFLKTLDRTSLLTMKDIIFEDPFFWDVDERVEFFAHKVSLKLGDQNFMKSVRRSDIRQVPWDKNGTELFKRLVEKMNDHRDAEERKRSRYNKGGNKRGTNKGVADKGDTDESKAHYDGKSLQDYVKCVCGAYTHWKQIQLHVDDIVRENHPTICTDMKRIIQTSNNLVS